jgi:hypothetical protein
MAVFPQQPPLGGLPDSVEFSASPKTPRLKIGKDADF